MIVGKAEKQYEFKDDISLIEYDFIKKNAKFLDVEIPISSVDWWKERSTFGEMFLENIEISADFVTIDYTDWEMFHPVFEMFFVTPEEYEVMKNNVLFINAKTDLVIDDYYFIEWILFTFHKIETEMSFKKRMIFYYYTLMNIIIGNVKNFEDILFKQSLEGKGMYG